MLNLGGVTFDPCELLPPRHCVCCTTHKVYLGIKLWPPPCFFSWRKLSCNDTVTTLETTSPFCCDSVRPNRSVWFVLWPGRIHTRHNLSHPRSSVVTFQCVLTKTPKASKLQNFTNVALKGFSMFSVWVGRRKPLHAFLKEMIKQ